jgi:hypothetical protein
MAFTAEYCSECGKSTDYLPTGVIGDHNNRLRGCKSCDLVFVIRLAGVTGEFISASRSRISYKELVDIAKEQGIEV